MFARSIGGIIGSTCTFRPCASGVILSSKAANRNRVRAEVCRWGLACTRSRKKCPKARPARPVRSITVPIFLTGSTGYIGAHVTANLLAGYSDPLNLLVRARSTQEAQERLWRSLQLHMNFEQFEDVLHSRIRIFLGDITNAKFGLSDDDYARLIKTTDSIIHCAASLNRKSEKSCLNVNLRGTL